MASQSVRRIIGIDPGSRVTGYGVIESDGRHSRCITYGCIKTQGTALAPRLHDIFVGVSDVILVNAPVEFAIENVFVAKNASSALKLGQARGAAICAGTTQSLPVAEYSPREVKLAIVGSGAADKAQVQHMVKILLNIKQEKIQEDAADALGIALCHAHTSTSPVQQLMRKALEEAK